MQCTVYCDRIFLPYCLPLTEACFGGWEIWYESSYSYLPAQVCNVIPPQGLSAYNTRLFKKESEGKHCYEVRLASAVKRGEEVKKKKSRQCFKLI